MACHVGGNRNSVPSRRSCHVPSDVISMQCRSQYKCQYLLKIIFDGTVSCLCKALTPVLQVVHVLSSIHCRWQQAYRRLSQHSGMLHHSIHALHTWHATQARTRTWVHEAGSACAHRSVRGMRCSDLARILVSIAADASVTEDPFPEKH